MSQDPVKLSNYPAIGQQPPYPGGFVAANGTDITPVSAAAPMPVTIAGGISRVENIWTDDSGAFFVRVDSGTAISWTDISGNASAAPGTGARPAAGASITIDRASYQANTSGTGFSSGDLIDHIVITDPTTGAVLGNFWINSTTSAKIAAPAGASLSSMTLAIGVADGSDIAQGAKADAAWSGSGSGSIVAILKAIWAAITGTVKTQPDGVADAATTAAWNGSSTSTTGYSTAYIEVTTFNTAITVKGGVAAANPLQVLNLLDNSTAATITATGLYAVPAVGNLTLTGLGTGVVNLMLKR